MIPVTVAQSAEIISADASRVVAAWADLAESGAAETLSELYDTSPGMAAVMVERARQVVDLGHTAARDDAAGVPWLAMRADAAFRAAIMAQAAGRAADAREHMTAAAALLIAALDVMDRADPARDGAA
jgi:hypothetical protein